MFTLKITPAKDSHLGKLEHERQRRAEICALLDQAKQAIGCGRPLAFPELLKDREGHVVGEFEFTGE